MRNILTLIGVAFLVIATGCSTGSTGRLRFANLRSGSSYMEPKKSLHGDIPGNVYVVTNTAELVQDLQQNKLDKTDISSTAPTFSNEVIKVVSSPITNLVIELRDRFYDPELDVTWKRNGPVGGRIFYDIESIGDSTGDNNSGGNE